MPFQTNPILAEIQSRPLSTSHTMFSKLSQVFSEYRRAFERTAEELLASPRSDLFPHPSLGGFAHAEDTDPDPLSRPQD